MKNRESVDKIIEILKQGALKYRDDFDKNLKCRFTQEEREDEIIIHFYIMYGIEMEYLIIFKKQKIMTSYIPEVKGHDKLELTSNPFLQLHLNDENVMFTHIYDTIQKINVAEIACYKKIGIFLRNPLDLTGIYNINIKYVSD